LTPGKVESVVPVFLRMIQAGQRVGGVLADKGEWWDLGDRSSYLAAHAELHALGSAFRGDRAPAVHPEAQVSAKAILAGLNVIGPGAIVEAGSELEDCILWPGARITSGARLRRCIVRSGICANGVADSVDF
jgi:mannose-1-phosphate guanylyltransferase